MYLAEFECTYPTYLRMYHSFSDIWKTVSNLRSQLLEATRTEGFDSATTTHLANQLDKFIRRSRSQKYRDDEIQLTLMVHKLRLLKQRLAVSQHNNNGSRHRDRILPITTSDDVTGDKIDRLPRSNNNNNIKSVSMKSSSSKVSSMSNNNNIAQSSNNNENKNSSRLINNCYRQLLTDSNDYSSLLPCNQV